MHISDIVLYVVVVAAAASFAAGVRSTRFLMRAVPFQKADTDGGDAARSVKRPRASRPVEAFFDDAGLDDARAGARWGRIQQRIMIAAGMAFAAVIVLRSLGR